MSFYWDLWTTRRPTAILRLTCLTWYDQESPALKGNSQRMWEAAAHDLFRQRCLSSSLTSSWWEILELCLCVCVCVRGGKRKRKSEWLRRRLCVRSPTWLFVSVWNGGEGSWGDISSAVWLSQFPREAVSRTIQKKNHRPRKKKKKKKKVVLFVGNLNYCRCLRLQTGGGNVWVTALRL